MPHPLNFFKVEFTEKQRKFLQPLCLTPLISLRLNSQFLGWLEGRSSIWNTRVVNTTPHSQDGTLTLELHHVRAISAQCNSAKYHGEKIIWKPHKEDDSFLRYGISISLVLYYIVVLICQVSSGII